MKINLNTGLMGAAAVLIAATAVAAPQGGSGSSPSSPQGTYGSPQGTTGSSAAQQGTTPGSMSGSSSASGQLTSAERKFVMEAASAGMLEIEAGRLAQQRAQDSEARSYAQRMVQEHTRNSQRLTQIAQSNGITPPRELMPKHQAMLDRLQRAKGAEFDEAYGKLMDSSHQETLQSFQRAQKQVKDPQLSAYISETLPTLQDHHAEARNLPGSKGSSRQALGGSSRDETGSRGGTGDSMGGTTPRPGETTGSSSGTTPRPPGGTTGSSSGTTPPPPGEQR